jgi:hypothetical protein
MNEFTFDIFSGGPNKDPIWIETVEGLSNARDRLERIAGQKPGQYFLFSFHSQTVVTRVETFANSRAGSRTKSFGAD